jgi:hypothetical protein
MRKFFGFCVLFLSVVWALNAAFRLFLGITGYVDWRGNGPGSHIIFAALQFALAYGAWKFGKFLRRDKVQAVTAES